MADPSPAGDRAAGARPALVLGTLASAVAAAACAAVFVLVQWPTAAAIATAIASAALVLGGMRAHDAPASRLPFADGVAERAVDAVILGAFAWAALPGDRAAAAAALSALVLSYLSSYVRAKAAGLGFRVPETSIVRPLRLGLVTVAVFAPEMAAPALSAAAAVSLQSLIRGAVSVGRQSEPA